MPIFVAHGEYNEDGRRVFYCGLGVESVNEEWAVKRIERTLGGVVNGIRPATSWPNNEVFELGEKLARVAEELRSIDGWGHSHMGRFGGV